jgi:RNA polymerase sigma-70 factor (ECF subfamily)
MRDLKFIKNQSNRANQSNNENLTLSALEPPYSTLEEFLKYIERRAFHMARLSTRQIDDAHDIVQEAMYKLIEKYADKQPLDWKPLFFTILNSKITDYYRRNSIKDKPFFTSKAITTADDYYSNWESDSAIGSETSEPDSQFLQQRNIHELSRCIEQLSHRQKQAFMMRCWEGYSTQETANLMACSEGSVKTHYSRAISKLKNTLEVNND